MTSNGSRLRPQALNALKKIVERGSKIKIEELSQVKDDNEIPNDISNIYNFIINLKPSDCIFSNQSKNDEVDDEDEDDEEEFFSADEF